MIQFTSLSLNPHLRIDVGSARALLLRAPAKGSHNHMRAEGPEKHNRSRGQYSRTLVRSRPFAVLHILLRNTQKERTGSR